MEDLKKEIGPACNLLRAVGHPARLAILCALSNGERCVGDLAAHLGLGQSNMSQHLSRLHAAGLVSRRRQHVTVYYGLGGETAEKLLDVLRELCCEDRPAARRYLEPLESRPGAI